MRHVKPLHMRHVAGLIAGHLADAWSSRPATSWSSPAHPPHVHAVLWTERHGVVAHSLG